MRSFLKMNRANQALVMLLILMTVGLWGCAQGKSSAPGSARLRDLESRHAKLEEDHRATTAAAAQARRQAAAAQQERDALRQRLEQANKEREELRQQVAARTGERDTLQSNLLQFSKELHTLAGRIDAAAGLQTGQPVTTNAGPELAPPQTPTEEQS
jgi:chromosome segregation ATPase